MKKIFTLSVFLLCALLSFSQAFQLDKSFNATGALPGSIIENVPGVDSATALIVQKDGKVVVGGNSNFNQITLVRYKVDGTKDSTFGDNGIIKTSVGSYCNVYSIAIQQDGKIVVAGYKGDLNGNVDLLILRYDVTGLLDPTFGSGGIFNLNIGAVDIINEIAIDAANNIVFVGESNSHALVGKVSETGTLQNFGGLLGYVIVDLPDLENETANALCIRESDNAIFFAGKVDNTDKDFMLGGYNSNGFPLANFGSNGIVTTNISGEDIANCVIISGENILVGGSSINVNHDFTLVQYDNFGQKVVGFGTSGITTTDINPGSDDIPYSVDLQKDGDILLGGLTLLGGEVNYAVARYNSNGLTDPNFDTDGKVTVRIESNVDASAMRLSNYRIYLAGTTENKNFSIAAILNSELALPIQLKSFLASSNGNAVELTWSGSAESKSSLFEIERSLDGKKFTRIGQVAVSSNLKAFTSYSFTDFKPSSINHYRLKMIDIDGKVAYSKIVVVRNSAANHFEVNPNPALSIIQVSVADPSVSMLTIYSSTGIPVQKVHLPTTNGTRTVPVDVSGLTRGIYYIKAGNRSLSFSKV